MALAFDPTCRQCPRLASHLDAVHRRYPDYHCAPVAPFGPEDAGLLIVGLAPGEHGANATGRPFTGDHAGILLYETLHRHGFASQPHAVNCEDGLTLQGCRITNAVKCLPPGNRPTTGEIRQCNPFLATELVQHPPRVILALGRIAHEAVLRARGEKLSSRRFAHGALHALAGDLQLLDSYHCSRYNTNTGRLTPAMFDDVIARARTLLS